MILKYIFLYLFGFSTLSQLVLLQSNARIATIAMQFTKVTYLAGKFADGSCCDHSCDLSKCQGSLIASFGPLGSVKEFGPIPTGCSTCSIDYNGIFDDYRIQDTFEYTWTIVDTQTGKLMDTLKSVFSPTPYTVVGGINTKGMHNNIELGSYFKIMCIDKYGPFCAYSCKPSAISYCDPISGFELCINGKFGSQCTLEVSACEGNPCTINGACISHGRTFECVCAAGFIGTLCERNGCNSDTCKFGVCANGEKCECTIAAVGEFCNSLMCPPNYCGKFGACSVRNNKYVCTCQTNRASGKRCEHVCPAVCKFNGRCLLYGSTPGCKCSDGRFGPDCSGLTNALPSLNPCYHGIVATVSSATATCECRNESYYRGSFCDVPKCSPSNCLRGNCLENKRCVCNIGYRGDSCGIPTCEGYPLCQNGGECIINGETSELLCSCDKSRFTGKYCELTCSNECAANQGECDIVNGKVECRCFSGFAGKTCEEPAIFDACHPNPCLHGTCTPIIPQSFNQFFCRCLRDWAGERCDKGICTSETCIHGVCASSIGCACFDGYSGANCELVSVDVLRSICQKNGFDSMVQEQFTSCNCDPTVAVQPLCELKCESRCTNGICVAKNGVGFCKCNAGFFGTTCSSTVEFPARDILHKVYIALIVLLLLSFIPIGLMVHFFKKRDSKTSHANSKFMHPVDRKVRDIPAGKIEDCYGTSSGAFQIKPLTLRK